MKKLKTILSLTTLLVVSSLLIFVSCKKTTDKPANVTTQDELNIDYIKVWGVRVSGNKVTVKGGDPKTVEVKLKNCNNFKLIVESLEEETIDGKVSVQPVEIPKTATKDAPYNLKITIKTDKFGEKTLSVKVAREDDVAKFAVKVKKTASGPFVQIRKDEEVGVVGSQAEVSVVAQVPMKEAKIGSAQVTMSADKKEAKATLNMGSVDVKVTFADHDVDPNLVPFTFTLKTVTADQLPVVCTSAKLFVGDVMKDPKAVRASEFEFVKDAALFDGEGVATWSTKGQVSTKERPSLEYGLVKVEMEFDVPINDVEIKCEDDRSSKYGTEPSNEDIRHGRISGYLTKRISRTVENQTLKTSETNYTHINGNKYTEYFIVGTGDTKYTLKFKANGRANASYKVVIQNPIKMNDKGQVTEGMPKLGGGGLELMVWDHNGHNGVFVNGLPCTTLPCYHGGPLLENNNVNTNNMSLALMGNFLNVGLQRYSLTKKFSEEGRVHFYYNVYEDTNEHKFVMCEDDILIGQMPTNDGQTVSVTDISCKLDVAGKYIDGFIGTKGCIPHSLWPFYTGNKVAKLAEHGFIANTWYLRKDEKTQQLKEVTRTATYRAQNYRKQALYAQKVEASGGTTEALTFAKNMKWSTWVEGKEEETVTTGDPKDQKFVLTGKDDILAVFMCFDSKETEVDSNKRPVWPKVSFSISKGTDGSTFTLIPDQQNIMAPQLNYGSAHCFLAGMPPLTSTTAPVDITTAFKFQEKDDTNPSTQPNVYKVEMSAQINATTTRKYTYILDYRENQVQVQSASFGDLGSSSMSDLFGVPTAYYSSIADSILQENGLYRAEVVEPTLF